MPEITVDIAGRAYRLGCGEGEEKNVQRPGLLHGRLETIDPGSQDEIALGETVDLVGEDLDLDPTPREANVRVVSLGLGEFAHTIRERECRLEVGE